MRSINLFVPPSRDGDEPRMSGLHEALRRHGLATRLLRVSSAALLPQLLDVARDAAAWAPSFTAYLLSRAKTATVLATPSRAPTRPHYAMVVARSGIETLHGLAAKRIGWVSKLSVTGYEIPTHYLRSVGLETESLFAEQRFCGSHGGVARALERGEVDAVATHLANAEALTITGGARILASVGPIPGDVVVAGVEMEPGIREALADAVAGLRGFARADHSFLRVFDVPAPRLSSGAFSFLRSVNTFPAAADG